MDNAHERRWPPGLLTLETRQMNRRQYEQVSNKLDRFFKVRLIWYCQFIKNQYKVVCFKQLR